MEKKTMRIGQLVLVAAMMVIGMSASSDEAYAFGHPPGWCVLGCQTGCGIEHDILYESCVASYSSLGEAIDMLDEAVTCGAVTALIAAKEWAALPGGIRRCLGGLEHAWALAVGQGRQWQKLYVCAGRADEAYGRCYDECYESCVRPAI